MTAKEKAKELFERFEDAAYNYFTNTGDGVEVVMLAKQSALIAVDEIIKVAYLESARKHWQEVKEEIEKL